MRVRADADGRVRSRVAVERLPIVALESSPRRVRRVVRQSPSLEECGYVEVRELLKDLNFEEFTGGVDSARAAAVDVL